MARFALVTDASVAVSVRADVATLTLVRVRYVKKSWKIVLLVAMSIQTVRVVNASTEASETPVVLETMASSALVKDADPVVSVQADVVTGTRD